MPPFEARHIESLPPDYTAFHYRYMVAPPRVISRTPTYAWLRDAHRAFASLTCHHIVAAHHVVWGYRATLGWASRRAFTTILLICPPIRATRLMPSVTGYQCQPGHTPFHRGAATLVILICARFICLWNAIESHAHVWGWMPRFELGWGTLKILRYHWPAYFHWSSCSLAHCHHFILILLAERVRSLRAS